MPLKKSKLPYLAGIIDGEGCFNIAKCRNSYTPRLLVTNTNENLINWLQENFGGDISKTVVKNKPHWKPRYMWRIANQKALDLTDKIYAYLVVKNEQALVFKVWDAMQNVFPKNQRKEGHEYLMEKIKNLNTKGIYAIQI